MASLRGGARGPDSPGRRGRPTWLGPADEPVEDGRVETPIEKENGPRLVAGPGLRPDGEAPKMHTGGDAAAETCEPGAGDEGDPGRLGRDGLFEIEETDVEGDPGRSRPLVRDERRP